MEKRTTSFLVGVGGWEHETFDHCFYPQPELESTRKLSLYAASFDSVEVRATFWDETLAARDAAEWVLAVSANRQFQFTVRLHHSFTHKKMFTPGATRNVRGVLHELARFDRLGALLAQFPYAFTNTSANRFHLVKLAEIFTGFPMFVELRHASWDHESLRDFLSENLLHPVSVDLPRLRQFISCRADVVGTTAYVRLHGRNEKGWLVNGIDTRYDYLYNGRELREIRRRVECLGDKAGKVLIMFNNTTGGKALINALQLQQALGSNKSISIPARMLQAFPYMHALAPKESIQVSLPMFEEIRDAV